MALIECGECGREVSDKAASCPGCGSPMATQRVSTGKGTSGGTLEAVGFLLIVGGMVAGMAGAGGPPAMAAFIVGCVVFLMGRFTRH